MVGDDHSKLAVLRSAFEQACREAANRQADPLAYLRLLAGELSGTLVADLASGAEMMRDMAFRAALAAASAEILPRLIREYEGRQGCGGS